jgi:Cu/Ag efflux protein CusF
MKRAITMVGFMLCASLSFAAQDVVSAVHGTVKKIDAGTKTVVVDAGDGTEHTFHYLGTTTVHSAKDTEKMSGDTLHGLKDGSKVAVHYTVDGTKETAREIDNIGDDGLKATKGTVSHVDKGAKTIAVKTEDGTEETFRMSDHAAKDTGKDIAAGADKSAKVTVFYTEDAGKKTAHFIEKAF